MIVGSEYHTHSIKIRVFRDEPDGLGLSAKVINRAWDQLGEAFKAAMLEALEKGILPRALDIAGTITITGIPTEPITAADLMKETES